ncbi:MAG: tetratricopeptide repeat-containing glycosyltransferase family 2 protein [Clostridium sp.]
MSNQTLSVCLIVKNEEKFLKKCLDSIKKFADEIVVVDTGSTDSTMEIAKSYGVKLIEHAWNNDFSEVRNISIENATMDWILFVDADEEIPTKDGEAIKILINEPKNSFFEGYYLRLVNIVDEQTIGDAIVFRLFRNREQYRFVGKMHEQIINSVQSKKGPDSIGSTGIRILHYGYDPKLSDQDGKCERNINLLLNYAEKDKDGYYYYALGNEYTRKNDYENAKKCYDKAIDMAGLSKGNMPIYYAYLISAMLKLFHVLKKYSLTLKYAEKFKKNCPDFKDIYFMEALAYIESNCFSKAKASLEKFKECENIKSTYTYPSNNFDGYNIPNLISQLEVAAIKHDPNLISSVVIYDTESEEILNTIKSLNEVSKEVLVVASINSKKYFEEIENIGGKIIKSSSKNEEELFYLGARVCRGKFILKLKVGEIFSTTSQKEIIGMLKSNISEVYRVNIVDEFGNYLKKELRLIRNNRKFNTLDVFSLLLNKSKAKEVSLSIHNCYKNNAPVENESKILEIGEFENNTVLIGGVINSTVQEGKELLKSIAQLNNENLQIDYYLFSNISNEELEEEIEVLEEDSETVILKGIEDVNEKEKYINEINDFSISEQYDYLVLLDSHEKIDKNCIYNLLTEKNDVVLKKIGENKNIIMISRDGLMSGMTILPIKALKNEDLELNISIRSEVLGLNLKMVQ